MRCYPLETIGSKLSRSRTCEAPKIRSGLAVQSGRRSSSPRPKVVAPAQCRSPASAKRLQTSTRRDQTRTSPATGRECSCHRRRCAQSVKKRHVGLHAGLHPTCTSVPSAPWQPSTSGAVHVSLRSLCAVPSRALSRCIGSRVADRTARGQLTTGRTEVIELENNLVQLDRAGLEAADVRLTPDLSCSWMAWRSGAVRMACQASQLSRAVERCGVCARSWDGSG